MCPQIPQPKLATTKIGQLLFSYLRLEDIERILSEWYYPVDIIFPFSIHSGDWCRISSV